MLNIVTIILARAGSKGIPNKNKMDFFGLPLFCWTVDQILRSSLKKYPIFISTDDIDIINIINSRYQNYDVHCIDRPPKLASDIASSDAALKHAIHYIESFRNIKVDIVVHPQVTSPLRYSEDFDNAINSFLTGQNIDSLFTASKLEDACIWNEKLQSITYDYKQRKNRQDKKLLYLENGSIYITRKKTLEKYKNRLGKNKAISLMHSWQSFELDSFEDIEIVSYYMQKLLRS